LGNEPRVPTADRPIYPFTAIVGQERMRIALLLHAVHPGLGGVLVRGEKGTAKSTAVRALARLLPAIDSVSDCPFGCDPSDMTAACDSCASRLRAGEPLPQTQRSVPLVELPLGATEDRVLGSLDLEAAIQHGRRQFEPGLLARANRGILYVDEVNLLADYLVDILLDAAAMGRNYVEREGISESHPASFMLVGTMNPEEGDLRPQFLDRFALVAEVEGLADPELRAQAVRRRIQFETNPRAFVATFEESERAERQRVEQARELLGSVVVPESILTLIVRICSEFDVDGLRADLAIYRAATALAAYAGRAEVDAEDVRTAAELALPHRRRRRPFEETGLDTAELDRLIDGSGSASEAPQGDTPSDSRPDSAGEIAPPTQAPTGGPSVPNAPTASDRPPPTSRVSAPDGVPQPIALPTLGHRRRTIQSGGRGSAAERDRHGHASGSAPPTTDHFELALAASLRAAAPQQLSRRAVPAKTMVVMTASDLRERVRQGRASSLVLFVVDASGSMGARDRMATTKTAVMGYLLDAYRRRDRIAVVAFRGRTAELILPPTNSVELAEKCLRFLPTGGTTPLAAGLDLAQATIERATASNSRVSPMLVLVSDGKANVAEHGLGPWESARKSAERVRKHGWQAVVLNTERGKAGSGLGKALAAALGADHVPLDVLVAQGWAGVASPGSRQAHAGTSRGGEGR
jgi:magnesium chelatase subunit D